MNGGDLSGVEHALEIAREKGFAEVSISYGGLRFRGALEPAAKAARKAPAAVAAVVEEESESDGLVEVHAGLVGFFRSSEPKVAVGDRVKVGDVVGVISSLGDIPIAVEATSEGEIVEFLILDGEPVQYGQVLAKVKP